MPLFVAQLYRLIPLIVFVVAILIIVYVVVWNTHGGQKAKEVLLKVLRWLSYIGIGVFILFTGYAAAEHNMTLALFFGSCLGLFVLMLVIDLICEHVLDKHERNRRFSNIAKRK